MLWPIAVLFQLLAKLRRGQQERNRRPPSRQIPVVIIGNIAVGGTGKTPLLIALANQLQESGLTPGIISRGYGGNSASYPLLVNTDCKVVECGDEALMLAEKTGCPLVIDPDRVAALEHLLVKTEVDVVLSDDGLQHYRLARQLEVCVVDGQRLFGNGMCLPAGPLREPISRLEQVDFIVVNAVDSALPDSLRLAVPMGLEPKYLINLATDEKRPFSGAPFNMGNVLQAVSAIGNPQRFYDLLEKLPYQMQPFSFPDHHLFSEEDFMSRGIDEHQPVVMTEKDAVKCRSFARNNYWYLSTELVLPAEFLNDFVSKVKVLAKDGSS
ncbi:MAG: tetraacyldisaccharide 4'-kinase [Gammaproteobacteria bacterium]|nr:tetraacyldisaccharide 4'-kinase [Gammaproteobacteria bacterium]MDP6731722.1 tetraacyldisaccharide 4'-kinase [Gammaproteobacteria bacterium]